MPPNDLGQVQKSFLTRTDWGVFTKRMEVRGLLTFPKPSGLTAETLLRIKYVGTGHQTASLGGCVGLRQRHCFNGGRACVWCGKVRPVKPVN